jgi:hypothetical protein
MQASTNNSEQGLTGVILQIIIGATKQAVLCGENWVFRVTTVDGSASKRLLPYHSADPHWRFESLTQ